MSFRKNLRIFQKSYTQWCIGIQTQYLTIKNISKRKSSYLKIRNIVSFPSAQTSRSHVHLRVTCECESQHGYDLLEGLFTCSFFFLSYFSFFFKSHIVRLASNSLHSKGWPWTPNIPHPHSHISFPSPGIASVHHHTQPKQVPSYMLTSWAFSRPLHNCVYMRVYNF